jgi:hypothetical protein
MRDAKEGVLLAKAEPLSAPPALQRVPGANYLLPNYDEYLIAYKDRGAVIDPERARNLGVFTSREFPHHVVLDGRVSGSWRRTITATTLKVDVSPYRQLSAEHKQAVIAQATRYARFLKLSHDVQIA